jgi:hypothetical protein
MMPTTPRTAKPAPAPADRRPRRPYSPVPHDLRKDPRLKCRDIAVAAALLAFARDKPTCWPSNARLAAETGCRSVRTIQASLARLRAAGWIHVEQGASNPTGRLITLVWRAEECAPPAPPVAPRAVHAVAPESPSAEKQKKLEAVRPGGGPPAVRESKPVEPSREDLERWAAGTDPLLRRIARAAMAEAGELPAEQAPNRPRTGPENGPQKQGGNRAGGSAPRVAIIATPERPTSAGAPETPPRAPRRACGRPGGRAAWLEAMARRIGGG